MEVQLGVIKTKHLGFQWGYDVEMNLPASVTLCLVGYEDSRVTNYYPCKYRCVIKLAWSWWPVVSLYDKNWALRDEGYSVPTYRRRPWWRRVRSVRWPVRFYWVSWVQMRGWVR